MSQPNFYEFNVYTLLFKSPVLEKAFRLASLPRRQLLARWASVLGLSLYATYIYIDILFLKSGPNLSSALAIRITVCVLCIIAFFSLKDAKEKVLQTTLSALALSAWAGLLLIMHLTSGEGGQIVKSIYWVGLIETSMFVYILSGIRWNICFVITTFMLLGYIAYSATESASAAQALNAIWSYINFNTIGGIACYVIERYSRQEFCQRLRHKALLDSMLPLQVSDRLAAGLEWPAVRIDSATILFLDIAGFTAMSRRRTPEEMVSYLSDLISEFDSISKSHSIERIRTVGDSVMISSGVPTIRSDHIRVMAEVSLKLLDCAHEVAKKHDLDLSVRIGIDTGSVIAAVVGKERAVYDIWGDAVNSASRMEKTSEPGRIHVTNAFFEALKNDYVFEHRGQMILDGIGNVDTHYLCGKGAEH